MYSDELPGEGQEAVAGPARAAAPMRSSSGMSDAGGRQAGSIVRGSSSMMSGQVSLAEDTGSNRASLMGSNHGSVQTSWVTADNESFTCICAEGCQTVQSCMRWCEQKHLFKQELGETEGGVRAAIYNKAIEATAVLMTLLMHFLPLKACCSLLLATVLTYGHHCIAS